MPFEKVNLGALPLEARQAHGGNGRIGFARLADRADLGGACNFIDYAVVPAGASIGEHRHGQDEEEFYLVLAGSASMRLDGRLIQVSAGDLIRNPPGGSHALHNEGSELVELFVFALRVPP